ncbi:MAG: alpha/beta hydrolase [Bacteroidales bacterium]|jgi:pimeloyl-ACP methyl ester carboxylesterase|nr:alpha/beta hydrolase [Bacteroidales bacterium]
MLLTVPFKNSAISVSDEGKGNVVVLLHGYLESLDIWDGFYERLTSRYRVVRIDIPGHGRSGVVAKIHTMDLMAEAVETVLQYLEIEKCVLVGHSMGGYVTLACLARFSKRLAGICLFHSSPFADTEEKRASRTKEIKLVEGGKLILICNTNIPNGFATDHLEKMADKLEFAKEVARRSTPEGVIAILEGMRSRPDRQELLKKNRLPVLFILGKKDNYISFDKLAPIAASFPHSTVSVLEESGHSGYFEEPEKSAGFILSFLDECYQ